MPRESPTPTNVTFWVLEVGVASKITPDALGVDVASDALSRERCAHARRNDSDM